MSTEESAEAIRFALNNSLTHVRDASSYLYEAAKLVTDNEDPDHLLQIQNLIGALNVFIVANLGVETRWADYAQVRRASKEF